MLAITFRMNFETQLEALRSLPHKRVGRWLSYVLFAVLPTILLYVAKKAGVDIWTDGETIPLPFWARVLICGYGFVFVLIPLLQTLAIYLARKKNPPQDISYMFDEKGFRVSAGPLNAGHTWTQIRSAKETNAFYFIYVEARMAYVIPKSVLKPEQQTALEAILQAAMPRR